LVLPRFRGSQSQSNAKGQTTPRRRERVQFPDQRRQKKIVPRGPLLGRPPFPAAGERPTAPCFCCRYSPRSVRLPVSPPPPADASGGRILLREVRKVEDLPATFADAGRSYRSGRGNRACDAGPRGGSGAPAAKADRSADGRGADESVGSPRPRGETVREATISLRGVAPPPPEGARGAEAVARAVRESRRLGHALQHLRRARTQTGKRTRRTGEDLTVVRMDALPDDLASLQ